MSAASNPVQLNDLTARDAHQSLWATRMRLKDLLQTVRLNAKAGFNALECWGGATYDVGIRFLNEDPWHTLREIKKAVIESAEEAGVEAPKLQMLLRGQTAIGYKNYPDDVIRAFVRQAAENGMNVFRIFDGLNDMRNIKTALDEVKKCQAEGMDVEAQGTICYTTGPEVEHANDNMTPLERQRIFNLDYYLDKARQLKEMGADSICLKDMAGLMDPDVASQLIPALKKETGLPVVMHMHAGMGKSDATLIAAIKAGADIVDVANAGLASGSGHTSEQMIKNMIKRSGDKELMARMPQTLDKPISALRKFLLKIRPKYRQWETPYNPDVQQKIYQAQIPGGMLSNFENQIKTQIASMNVSYEEVLERVLDEVPRVREDLGWPPLVTPCSQIVGSQAVWNVLSEINGGKRFDIIGSGTEALLLGRLGATPVEPNPELVTRVEKSTNTKRIKHRPADDLADGLPAARKAVNDNGIDGDNIENVLTAAMWDSLGMDYLTYRERGEASQSYKKNLEPEPEYPDHMKRISNYGYGFELYDLHQIIGEHVLEAFCQTIKELKRIRAGFFQGVSHAELDYRAERYEAYIKDNLKLIHEALAKSQLSDLQLDWFLVSAPGELNLNTVIANRCRELGAGASNDNVPEIKVSEVLKIRKGLSNPAAGASHESEVQAPVMQVG